MKPVVYIIFSLLATLCFGFSGYAQIPEEVTSEIRNRVDSGLNPSIVIGLYENGQEYFFEYGVIDSVKPEPASRHTFYSLGNLGNTLSGTLAARLAEKGLLNLNTPLGNLVSPKVLITDHFGKQVRLLDALSYQSGIEDLLAFEIAETPDWNLLKDQEFLEMLRPYRTATNFSYSDWAMGLAVQGISIFENTSYHELMSTEVLQPLKLQFHYLKHQNNFYADHAEIPDNTYSKSSGIPEVVSGAMYWEGSVKTLLDYGKLILDPPASWEKTMEIVSKTYLAPGNNPGAGLGWLKDLHGNLYHAGHFRGFNTFIAIDPSGQRVIVLATNTADADISDLGLYLLDPIKNPLSPFQEKNIDLTELHTYEGFYTNDAMGLELELAVEEGELKSVHQQDTVSLHFMGKHCFFYKGLKAHLSFEKDENDQVVGVTLNNNGKEVMFIKMH